MIHALENDRLCIQISDDGAELISIFDKKNQREVLWQADPAYWKRHAPLLFPNVGRNYRDRYLVNGTEYHSKQHGFARDMKFTCIDTAVDSITHQLKADEKTREVYPFAFELRVQHILRGNQILICWKVIAPEEEALYFTIGGHPAFRVPAAENTVQSDYLLHFDGQESLSYLLIDPDSGTAAKDTAYTLELTNGSCPIGTHMFDKDALIFDNGQITRAEILLPDGSPYVALQCEGFPNFGIWSVPGAPFVCLEPWMGRCDNCGYDGELADKPGIQKAEPGMMFEQSYGVQVF